MFRNGCRHYHPSIKKSHRDINQAQQSFPIVSRRSKPSSRPLRIQRFLKLHRVPRTPVTPTAKPRIQAFNKRPLSPPEGVYSRSHRGSPIFFRPCLERSRKWRIDLPNRHQPSCLGHFTRSARCRFSEHRESAIPAAPGITHSLLEADYFSISCHGEKHFAG